MVLIRSLLMLALLAVPLRAARLFSSAGDVVQAATVTIPQTAGAAMIWFYPTSAYTDSADRPLWWIGNVAGDQVFYCVKAGDNKLYTGWFDMGSDGQIVKNGGDYPYVLNTWNLLIYQWNNSTNTLYINDVSQGTCSSCGAATWDTSAESMKIGNRRTELSTPAARFAWMTIWDNNLGTNEQTALYKGGLAGAPPWRFQPTHVVYCWPIDGAVSPEPSWKGITKSLTVTGTAAAMGPSIMRLVRPGIE